MTHPWMNFSIGFDTRTRGCYIDMAMVDDKEQCHVELGFAKNCSYTPSGKCRLCRACAKGYWAQGVSNCYECPPMLLNIVLVILCIVFVLIMLMSFLSGALQDSGAEADSTVIHLSQAQQKILLNHIQLISLASGFPLKWPDVVQNMFEIFSMFGNAGSYVFNPACSDVEIVKGERAFFQKTLGITILPFIALAAGALFWLGIGIHDCFDPPEQRLKRRNAAIKKKKLTAALKLKQLHEKRYQKIARRDLKRNIPSHPINTKEEEKLIDASLPNNGFEEFYENTLAKKKSQEEKEEEDEDSSAMTITSQRSLQVQGVVPASEQDEISEGIGIQTRKSFDGNNEQVKVICLTVFPLVPLGIVWEGTVAPVKKTKVKARRKSSTEYSGTLQDKYVARIKKIKSSKQQAGIAGLKIGDILQTVDGQPMVSMTVAEIKKLFKKKKRVGQPFQITFVRKTHSLKEDIQKQVRVKMSNNKSSITIWDKFVATTVTMLYLLYPTVTRATFTLVACQQIGSKLYLQMDLDVTCYEAEHNVWVFNVFIPALILYVIGMPLLTLIILFPKRHDLGNRWTKFRYGVLFTGYRSECFYWESVIAGRKAAVITVSVFFTTAGAEAQALCALLIIMLGTVAHLLFRPFQRVSETRHTLFWSEFWGLQTAFITFWTGLFFFQDVAKKEEIQMFFTIELLFFNAIFLMAGIRWYCILKLMDVTDMLNTKLLQGYPPDLLTFEFGQKRFLSYFFPEWAVAQNLWSRRAWQGTVRTSILSRRALGSLSEDFAYSSEDHNDHRFRLGNTDDLHKRAMSSMGISTSKRKSKSSANLQRSGRTKLKMVPSNKRDTSVQQEVRENFHSIFDFESKSSLNLILLTFFPLFCLHFFLSSSSRGRQQVSVFWVWYIVRRQWIIFKIRLMRESDTRKRLREFASIQKYVWQSV